MSSSAAWRSTIRLIRSSFRAGSARHGDLRHVLAIAVESGRDNLAGPPFGPAPPDPLGVQVNGRTFPLRRFTVCGTARSLTARARAPGVVQTEPAVQFRDGFFGCADLTAFGAAASAFERLAAAAWRSVPIEVRREMTTEPYLDPRGATNDSQAWVLAVYTVAWATAAGSALKADRLVYAPLAPQGHVQLNFEPLFRLPDPVHSVDRAAPESIRGMFPQRSRDEEIADSLETFRTGPWGEVQALEFPPKRFVAFLEPDPFLASALAIDAILERHKPARRRGGVERPPSAAREPATPTTPASISAAAGWFKMHRRTLQRAIRDGTIAARRITDRRWVFDLDELRTHNRGAADKADPARRGKRGKAS